MYSRPPQRPQSVRVPENYSGCAFSERQDADLPPRYLEVAKPSIDMSPSPPPPCGEKHGRPMPPYEEKPCHSTSQCEEQDGYHKPPYEEQDGYHKPPQEEKDDCRKPPQEEKDDCRKPSAPLFGNILPFSDGLAFDQLLILGLILLLLREGTENDTVLCLALLLFCA